MNREQKEVLSLLKEIDTICERHGINYYLSPQLTLCAVTGQPFPQNPMAGIVVMTVEDMERFRQVLGNAGPEGRELEYMGNNKRFPGFYLRYENTDTLCYRLDEGRNFRFPGIGVNILPLRSKIPSRLLHLWNRAQEVGWGQICGRRAVRFDGKKFFSGLLARILCIFGRARLGRHLYKKFCGRQSAPGAKEYVLRRKKDTVYYPTEIFENPQKIELEGESFLVPGDIQRYLSKVYGKKYLERAVEKYTPNPAVMVSACVKCQDYLDEVGDQRSLVKNRRRMYRKSLFGRGLKKYFNQCCSYAKFCASKHDLTVFYEDKKDYIISLYKNEDYLSLEKTFAPYTKMMEKCLKKKELYAADEEIMEIYLDVLGKTGKTVLKGKVERYWR